MAVRTVTFSSTCIRVFLYTDMSAIHGLGELRVLLWYDIGLFTSSCNRISHSNQLCRRNVTGNSRQQLPMLIGRAVVWLVERGIRDNVYWISVWRFYWRVIGIESSSLCSNIIYLCLISLRHHPTEEFRNHATWLPVPISHVGRTLILGW